MRLARLVLMVLLVAGWGATQAGAQATAADDKGKQDSPAAAGHKHGEGMSCCCCKDMAKKDAAKSGDAAKPEAKSEGGMMAGGMGCCGGGKDGAGMKCGGSDSKPESTEQKMK